MLCENCRERDAVVHFTKVVDGEMSKRHLCEKCAAELGVETSLTAPKSALVEFLMPAQKQLAVGGGVGDAGRCTFCSATLRDFKQTGRLGCARCYTAFEGTLRDLLRRVHGNARHVGRQYREPELTPPEGGSVLNELRDRLRRAVETEQFELAAELRDRIKVLE